MFHVETVVFAVGPPAGLWKNINVVVIVITYYCCWVWLAGVVVVVGGGGGGGVQTCV